MNQKITNEINLDEDWDQPSLFDEKDLQAEFKSEKAKFSFDERMEKKLKKKMRKEDNNEI